MKLRMRVKGSSKGKKPEGGSCSSNPKSMKHRSAARAQRIAGIYPMIAVDEREDGQQKQQLEKAILLPMDEMSLDGKRGGGKQQNALKESHQKKALKQVKHEESTDLLKQLASSDISLEGKQKLLKKEHQLWQILPAHFSEFPKDFQQTMPILAPILGAALNERPDLRLKALASIRAALQMDDDQSTNIMRRFAKNFLPILFSIYTNDQAEEENGRKVDPKAVHLSTLETLRLYMRHIPAELLKQYISVALKKLTGPDVPKGQISEKNLSLADILITMCISADSQDLKSIFNCLEPWFESEDGRMVKKAYRLMAQVYQRIEEAELKEFFAWNRPLLDKLIEQGVEKLNKSAFQWRIAIFRNVLDSFNIFDECSQFCFKIQPEIIAFLDPSNSSPTRKQAANCLMEMAQQLLRLWTLEGENSKHPLDWMFGELFVDIVPAQNAKNNKLQCALIALNILVQKQLKHANASLISQLIAKSTLALEETPHASNPQCRVLTIRLFRTICTKLPPFMFDQYKDLILKAVFSQSTKNPTVRIRKSNAILLNLLLERLGLEELLKFNEAAESSNAGDKLIWAKMLKNLEKMRRRRERKKQQQEGGGGQLTPSMDGGRSRVGGSSMVSGCSSAALSSLISLGAKTANADSIFDILGEESSDDEEGEAANRQKSRMKRNGRGNKLSVVIEEGGGDEEDSDGEEEDPLDLLDRKALENKVSLVKQKNLGKRGEMMKKRKAEGGGEFRVNKEGKLLIEDLDEEERKPKKKRRRRRIEDDDEDNEGNEEEKEEEE